MTSTPRPVQSAGVSEKRVSWAELFFDLVFVFSVTEVSALLLHDHGWSGLLRALVVFVAIYWLWVGTAVQTNLRDTAEPLLRIRIFGVALAAVFMALSLPGVYGETGLLFAAAYWAGRLILGVGFLLHDVRVRRLDWTPYTVSILVTGPLLVVGAFTDADLREVIWGLAALLDLSTPTVLRSRLRSMQFDAGHLAERFGLFVLIALGESVVAIGASARSEDGPGLGVACAVVAAFTLSGGLWWVYFHFATDTMRHALATAQVQLDIARLVLSYGHLSLIVSIVVVSVGLHEAVAHPGDELGWGVTSLLYGGTAVFLATFGFTRWAMFRLVSWTRLTAAAAVVMLLVPAVYLPALAALSALSIVVVALNVVEFARVEKIGWRALLARR